MIFGGPRGGAVRPRLATLQRALVDDARKALDAANLPPTEVVRTIPPETDPSRLM